MRVRAEIDLKALGLTTSQWREFIKWEIKGEIKKGVTPSGLVG
jgi:hypothetical protein